MKVIYDAIIKIKQEYEDEYKAIKEQAAKDGKIYISTTQLIDSPYIYYLNETRPDIKERPEDAIYSLYGSALHKVIEAAGGSYIKEVRYFIDIDNYRIGGKIDVFDPETGTLYDLKKMSKYYSEVKNEYKRQLQVNAYIMEENGLYVKNLAIIGLFMDYNARDYFDERIKIKSPIAIIEVPKPSNLEIVRYIRDRLKLFKNPEEYTCSEEDRWAEVDWILPGAHRAKRVFKTQEEAIASGLTGIEKRVKDSKRCESYCKFRFICTKKPNKYMENL